MGKIKEKANHFWTNGISIDETRVSLLMIMMVVAFGVAIWQVFTIGDLNPNLMQLLFMIIGAVTGINMVSVITNKNANKVIENNQQNYDDRI